jgi:hypothetical protein
MIFCCSSVAEIIAAQQILQACGGTPRWGVERAQVLKEQKRTHLSTSHLEFEHLSVKNRIRTDSFIKLE